MSPMLGKAKPFPWLRCLQTSGWIPDDVEIVHVPSVQGEGRKLKNAPGETVRTAGFCFEEADRACSC